VDRVGPTGAAPNRPLAGVPKAVGGAGATSHPSPWRAAAP